jgi:hypothetical protein
MKFLLKECRFQSEEMKEALAAVHNSFTLTGLQVCSQQKRVTAEGK